MLLPILYCEKLIIHNIFTINKDKAMKKNTRKHTHIPKAKKTKKVINVNAKANTKANNFANTLSDSEKQKIANMNKMYDILQEQMSEYLGNLEEKRVNQEKEEIKLSPDEKIKEFNDMLSIFTKFEALSRKLESHIERFEF